VIRREPELAGPRANLGNSLRAHRHRRKALESLQQAIRLNPDRAVLLQRTRHVSRREGRSTRRAATMPKHSLSIRTTPTRISISEFCTISYLQDTAKAMQHYQRYRELMPSEAGTVTKWIADLQQRGRATEQAKGGKSG